jgi:dolichol-phosphate mannosyltransferase
MTADMNGGEALELSVVIPVHNEAGNAAPLAGEIHAAMAALAAGGFQYEIIFVDDGSTDATAGELAALTAADSKLRVVTHVASCGQSQATISGAAAARGTWIATLDGDGQNDPADIPRLLAERDRYGADERVLFIGRRARRRDSAARMIASKVANGIRGALLRDSTPDSGCGIKLIRRDLFLELPRFNALHRFMPALVMRAGGRAVSVPVNHRPRTRGVSKYGILQRGAVGLVDLWGVFWLLRRNTLPRLR